MGDNIVPGTSALPPLLYCGSNLINLGKHATPKYKDYLGDAFSLNNS